MEEWKSVSQVMAYGRSVRTAVRTFHPCFRERETAFTEPGLRSPRLSKPSVRRSGFDTSGIWACDPAQKATSLSQASISSSDVPLTLPLDLRADNMEVSPRDILPICDPTGGAAS